MNILFFLTPKSEVTYVRSDYTLAKTLEILEQGSYMALPMINRNGDYVGTLTEGDILWAIKNNPEITFENASRIRLEKIERQHFNPPLNVNMTTDELLTNALTQNFVPVIDDAGKFIGIVTRKDVIRFLYKKLADTDAARIPETMLG